MDDFAKLKHWATLLRAGEAVTGEVTARMSERMLGLVDEGFETQTDPYGEPWAPKKTPDGRKVLEGPTGRLRQFVSVPHGKHRFVLVPGADYAAPHQAPHDGKRPRRMMVPAADRGLPDEWSRQLSKTAQDSMRAHFNKR